MISKIIESLKETGKISDIDIIVSLHKSGLFDVEKHCRESIAVITGDLSSKTKDQRYQAYGECMELIKIARAICGEQSHEIVAETVAEDTISVPHIYSIS